MTTVHRTNNNKDLIDYEISRSKNENNLELKALKAMKNKILSFLTQEELMLIRYKFYMCLTAEEISKKMNISRQAVDKKINKLSMDINQIIDRYLELYSNIEVLNDKEIQIYKLFYLYRLNYLAISKKLKVSRHTIAKSINEINYKLKK